MKSITVYQYDAFSKEPNKGNPAGVVLDGDDLSEAEMQKIAFKVGFNETAFPIKSDIADLRIRFFIEDKTKLTIETNAGILSIKMNEFMDGNILITMEQAPPQFKEFTGSKKDLTKSIRLKKTDLHADLPILYGSTGTWTLIIPIKHLKAFQKMEPNNKQFPEILKEMPNSSVHPFCLETYDLNADMHARHFSSP